MVKKIINSRPRTKKTKQTYRHAGSTWPLPLTLSSQTLRVSARWGSAMKCICLYQAWCWQIKPFPVKARTHIHTESHTCNWSSYPPTSRLPLGWVLCLLTAKL